MIDEMADFGAFEESDAPADDDDSDQTCILEYIPFFHLQMSVPCERHEKIRNDKKGNGEYGFQCVQK